MVSAFLLGMRREVVRAAQRGVEIDSTTEAVQAAVARGEALAAEDVAEFAEFDIEILQGGAPVGFGDEADAVIVDPTDAVEFIRNRVPLKSKTIERLIRTARKRGVVTSASFAADARELIDEGVREIVEEGVPLEDAASHIREVFEQAGMTGPSPHRLNTILRTNVQTAYNAGRWEMLKDPAMREAFPYLIYRTMDDDRVRDTHELMHNKAYRIEHPIWRVWFPPNGYN